MLVLEFIFRALSHIFRAKSIQPPLQKWPVPVWLHGVARLSQSRNGHHFYHLSLVLISFTVDKSTTPTRVFKKGSPFSIAERIFPELIPVLDSQPAGDVSHKPGGRLPLLSARTAVTLATLKRAANNFTA